jgi:hypothetical protein
MSRAILRSPPGILDCKNDLDRDPDAEVILLLYAGPRFLKCTVDEDRPAVHKVREVLMGPLVKVENHAVPPSFNMPTTTIRPPGRSTRLHSAGTSGISGVSDSSRVKLIKTASSDPAG